MAESVSLIRRVVAAVGRPRAHDFDAFIARHQSALRAFLRRLCDDDAVADDLAQATFLKAQRALPSYRGEGSEASWLLRIGYREFLDHRRRHRREQRLDDIDAVDTDSAARTHRVADGRIAERDVRRALRVLSDDERAAIAACFYEGLTHEEAAVALEMPLGTLKSHVARAREKLRVPLAAYGPPALTAAVVTAVAVEVEGATR